MCVEEAGSALRCWTEPIARLRGGRQAGPSAEGKRRKVGWAAERVEGELGLGFGLGFWADAREKVRWAMGRLGWHLGLGLIGFPFSFPILFPISNQSKPI